MTPAKLDHPTVRLSSVVRQGREIVVEVFPYHMALRLKGTRDRVIVPYQAALDLGYKLRYREQQAEKKMKKKAKAGG
jgi:hypothetical protein